MTIRRPLRAAFTASAFQSQASSVRQQRLSLWPAIAENRAHASVEYPAEVNAPKNLTARMRALPVESRHIGCTVVNGRRHHLGPVDSNAERMALKVAAENTPGVRMVDDRLFPRLLSAV